MRENNSPYMIERLVAGFSYLTMGTAGFIRLIISSFRQAALKTLLQYHIFQSIFISLAFAVLSIFIGWLSNLLSFIPFINRLVAQITFLLNMPLIFSYSLIQTVIYILLIYLAVMAFAGKYSYIPWISDIIDQNVSR